MTKRLIVKSLCFAILLSALATSVNAASARKLVREGNRAYKAGQFDQALAKYKAALMEGGDPGVVAYNLGNAHYNLGESQAAQEAYVQSLRPTKAGDLAASLYNLGNAYFQKQELDKAEEYYQKAIKGEPGNADAHNNLAWLYYTKKENLDQAETLALKALELNPAKENVYRDTLDKIREMKSDLANKGDRK